MDNIYLGQSVIRALETANGLSEDFELRFIPSKILFLSLFLSSSAIFKKLSKKDNLTEKYISSKILELIEESLPQEYRTAISISIYDFLPLECDILKVFENASEIAQKTCGNFTVEVENLFDAYVKLHPEFFLQFISKLKPEPDYLEIPDDFASFLTILKTNKFCSIGGMDHELLDIMHTLLKHSKHNVLLIGDSDICKTSIVKKLAWQISTRNCPEDLKNAVVLSLDIYSLIKSLYKCEEIFIKLIDFLESLQFCILFINLTLITSDVANFLDQIILKDNIRVICSATAENPIIQSSQFEKVYVVEPKSSEVYSIIIAQVQNFKQYHGVNISKENIDYAMYLASCFDYQTPKTIRTLNLIDKSMVCAKCNNHKFVTKKDIINSYSIYFKHFKELSVEEKISVAYHEAGHFIVGKFSESLTFNCLAVSIVPVGDCLGVTVFDDSDIRSNSNLDFFKEQIACLLAGRIAEIHYTNGLSAKASADLKDASDLAFEVVTQYALDPKYPYRIYVIDGYNQQLIENAYKQADELLKRSYEYAENMLKEHLEDLNLIVSELVKHGILSGPELEKILNKR
ncbi:MAG TPA: hypothetical protein OIM45_00595 [Clostridiaceae bacterium]|nr:hypothetical protein [Clostridiaceae bacterium]